MGEPPIDLHRPRSLSCVHFLALRVSVGHFKAWARFKTMNYKVPISSCFLLASILSLSLTVGQATAKKLSAQPLPHESDGGGPQQIVPAVSRFYKGNDAREEEKRREAAEARSAQQVEADR